MRAFGTVTWPQPDHTRLTENRREAGQKGDVVAESPPKAFMTLPFSFRLSRASEKVRPSRKRG